MTDFEFEELAKHIKVIKIDVDQNQMIAARLQIQVYHTYDIQKRAGYS